MGLMVVLIGFGGGCSGLGFGGGCLFWVWVGGGWLREGNRETKIRENRDEERRQIVILFYFYILCYCVIYTILKYCM